MLWAAAQSKLSAQPAMPSNGSSPWTCRWTTCTLRIICATSVNPKRQATIHESHCSKRPHKFRSAQAPRTPEPNQNPSRNRQGHRKSLTNDTSHSSGQPHSSRTLTRRNMHVRKSALHDRSGPTKPVFTAQVFINKDRNGLL